MDVLQNLDLLTVGMAIAAIVILGFLLYFSDRTKAVNRSFLFFSLSASAWSLVNYISYQVTNYQFALYSIRGVLFFAVLLAFFMFKLMYSLPGRDVSNKVYYKFVIVPVVFFTLILTLSPWVVKNISNFNPNGTASSFTSGPGILFFGITVLSLFLLGIIILFKDALMAKGDTRKQFRAIFPGFLITIVLLLVFNFYFPAFLNNSRYIDLGALFIFPFIAFTFYAIFRHKLFNIKDVTTVTLSFALTSVTFVEIIYASGFTQVLFRSSIFLLVLIFSIQLIRNMIKLEQANVRLQELDKLKSEFVSLATHQIRAPLSAIKGYLSEVFEGGFGTVTPELEKVLRIVFQSTENLVHIVGDFLNISRIEQNKMKYELAPLDLKKLVEDLVKELKPNIDRVGLGFSFEAGAGDFTVNADIGKVREVVSNLVDNALKYTPKGSIKLSLSADEAKKKVLLKISDTGIGIDPAVMPKLFQKFTRAEGANEVNIIGTGLGLYVAKMMIEGMQGRIWAESEGKDKGSQFYVELPIVHIN